MECILKKNRSTVPFAQLERGDVFISCASRAVYIKTDESPWNACQIGGISGLGGMLCHMGMHDPIIPIKGKFVEE